MGHGTFTSIFTKIIKRFINKGYDPNSLSHTGRIVFIPYTVGRYAFLLITSDGPS